MNKPKVGVMGAADDALSATERSRLAALAEKLGAALAKRNCAIFTGATTGLPHLVTQAARKHGALTVGVSPATNREEHLKRYGMPEDGAELLIYTGFGLKGRNVVTVRSSDVVLIFGGATGTLNEFTIAYDEGKVIGVLEGSGGIADHIEEVLAFCNKTTRATVIFDKAPERLIDKCLRTLAVQQSGTGKQ
jgi:uncharacterized protein (TIGR00725 family)